MSRAPGHSALRRRALLGLAGAVLSGVGDLLILGRPASGAQFDRAEGLVPASVEVDPRWRSLWNGAQLPAGRIHLGTLIGVVGIGLLQWRSLHSISRVIRPGRLRNVAAGSAAVFAVSGVLTHASCGAVILAYRKAVTDAAGSSTEPRPAGRPVTRLLAVSAAGALGALAVFSSALTIAGWRRRVDAPTSWWVLTPFPYVLTTLLTFGALPAPVGGYARPASISIGLAAYFAIAAAGTDG